MKKIVSIVCFLALLVGLFIPALIAHAQGPLEPDPQAVDSFLQEQVKTNRIPGVAVAIVKDGKTVFQKGYGNASPGKPATPQTQFYLGSVSKGFTALAVMKLVDQGKLELDVPVQSYLPWFKVADEQVSKQITIRNLLNHTSGLTEKGDPNSSAYTASLDEQARLLLYVKPTYQPGTHYEYYNQNYRLLGLVIEQVSGKTYGEFLKETIFLPLGMGNTVANPADAIDLAQGYSRFFGFPLPQSQEFIPGALPSGYLITTTEDMSRYLIGQLGNQQADNKPLVSAGSFALMHTPPTNIKSDYAMGWMVLENSPLLIHGGAVNYFQSFVAINTQEKTGFVVLFNQNSMENMLFESTGIRTGLMDYLGGKKPSVPAYGWVGWLLLGLFTIDMANQFRLFRMLPRWIEKTARQSRVWLWIKVGFGLLFPLAVLFGLPALVNILEGGSPNWIEPYKLMPDIIVWLLLGMTLDLVRNIIHAVLLIRKPAVI
jgi:CubicO group peptidase (beta-lactamase class C family)